MKKRTNKGMALASTLILMTIVLMMSALMMTVTLFGAQVSGLQRTNIDNKVLLDEIGNRFLKNKNNPAKFLKYFIDETVAHSDESQPEIEMNYYNLAGNPVSEAQNVVKGKYKGLSLILTISDTSSKCSLTVSALTSSGSSGRQLMEIVCSKQTDQRTGEVTVKLKSWKYGD